MLILTFGSEYFHDAFVRQGHKVIATPHEDGFPLVDFYNTLRDRPDVFIYTDHLGHRAWPQGIDELDIPKIYYGLDTPINFWWQKHFANLFDLCFMDQKPYVQKLEELGLEARWLPLAVNTDDYRHKNIDQEVPKIYDFTFVGVVNEQVRAKRSRLIKQLSARFSLKNIGDHRENWVDPKESTELYRQSRLILNENLFPGVTTRMLEAMSSGTVLFTEKAGGDLGELFQPGEDFAWFDPQDVMNAAEYWLADEVRLKKMGARALEKMRSSHDINNRAETVIAAATTLNLSSKTSGPEAWDFTGRTLFLTALRWPKDGGKERINRAERLFLKAADEGELAPEGKFMLGHICRLKGEVDKAIDWLNRSWDEGFNRAAMGLGILAMSSNKAEEATVWFKKFTNQDDFPSLSAGEIHFEAVKPLSGKLVRMGEAITPGFNLMPHDPALWTAFEFYITAHQARPWDLEVGRCLSNLLLECGAPAEAMDVAGNTLEHHPADEMLSHIYSQGARGSYLNLN